MSKIGSSGTAPANGNYATLNAVEENIIAPVVVQIIAGSYDRVLHGITATIPGNLKSKKDSPARDEDVTFADTFLLAAHTSSIRCLALSPPTDSHKRLLATGGSDEQIKLYSLSTTPPAPKAQHTPTLLSSTSTAENAQNRDIGSLLHHDRAVTCLHFPTKAKLFSAAEDNTIAISRTRDWTVLSTIKAPIPKAQGRPSGDTAAPGEVPAGVNDFAIHPSNRLMLSVGRGERCMRLWNLMTGKKAGVLSFDRSLLLQVGETKYGSGEGRRVLWDENGEVFVVSFERGAAVFGTDSKPRAVVRPSPPSKIHQVRFIPESVLGLPGVLALSTEDGRILFFSLAAADRTAPPDSLPACKCVAQLGGRAAGISSRLKDFEILGLPVTEGAGARFLVVAGSSDGAVRLWTVLCAELSPSDLAAGETKANDSGSGDSHAVKQVGVLTGTHETGNRITCVTAFVMDGVANGRAVADHRSHLGANEEDGEDGSDG